MSDLQEYIENRKKTDPEFAESYDSGYKEFKIGVILREARRKSGLTQEELARRIRAATGWWCGWPVTIPDTWTRALPPTQRNSLVQTEKGCQIIFH